MAKKDDLAKAIKAAKLPVGPARIHDDEFQKAFPNVYSHLVPAFHDDVMVRQEARLTVSVRGGLWVWGLELPTEGVECDGVADSLLVLWDSMEAKLASGNALWRPNWKSRKKHLQEIERPLD